jgi:hypothetical protein
MGAYKDALHITGEETGSRASLAVDALTTRRGVVVLDGLLALRPEADHITCEVIASSMAPSQYRSAIEDGQSLLNRSTIFNAISGTTLLWVLVEDYGTGVGVLAHGS